MSAEMGQERSSRIPFVMKLQRKLKQTQSDSRPGLQIKTGLFNICTKEPRLRKWNSQSLDQPHPAEENNSNSAAAGGKFLVQLCRAGDSKRTSERAHEQVRGS